MSRTIWWVKRDLRLADIDVLHDALDAHDELLVLAIVEPPQSGVIRGLSDRGTRQPIIKARLFDTAPRPAPQRLPGNAITATCDAWPDWTALNPAPTPAHAIDNPTQPVNEAAGHAVLADFLNERGVGYSGGISSPNTAFTHGSRLSVHIARGTLSLRTLHHRTLARMKAVQATAGSGFLSAAKPADQSEATLLVVLPLDNYGFSEPVCVPA